VGIDLKARVECQFMSFILAHFPVHVLVGLRFITIWLVLGVSPLAAHLVQEPELDSLFARTAVVTLVGGNQVYRGTGFLLEPDIVVTNFHVAGGKNKDPRTLEVTLRNKTVPVVDVVAIDELNDLVFLRLARAFVGLPTMATGKLSEGERVFGLGFSLDSYYPIKVKGRFRETAFIAAQQLHIIEGITAHGQSGGAMINASGKLVGVAMGALKENKLNGLVIPWEKVEQLQKQGNRSLGLDALTKPKLIPGDHPQLQAMAQALAEHDFVGLVTTAQALMRQYPECPEVSYYLGQGLYGKKEFAKAEMAFRRAVALVADGQYPDALGGLGLIALNKGNQAEAIAFFHRALALYGSHRDALYQLGRISTKSGQFDEALNYLERYIRLAPKDKEAWELLALTKARLGDSEGAKEAWRVSAWLIRTGADRIAATPTWQRFWLWCQVQWASLFH
jgi:hypothetical protein